MKDLTQDIEFALLHVVEPERRLGKRFYNAPILGKNRATIDFVARNRKSIRFDKRKGIARWIQG